MNAEDLFLQKYGNKIMASESWVIRFAEEYNQMAEAKKWISVESEKPDYYKSVLSISKNNSHAVVHRVSDGDNEYYIISGTDVYLANVTYWKNLTEFKN